MKRATPVNSATPYVGRSYVVGSWASPVETSPDDLFIGRRKPPARVVEESPRPRTRDHVRSDPHVRATLAHACDRLLDGESHCEVAAGLGVTRARMHVLIGVVFGGLAKYAEKYKCG